MDLPKIKETIGDIFSGDNSRVDFTNVNSGIWILAILAMWIYKSLSVACGLVDIPQGVVVVLVVLIGAAPASSLVNILGMFFGARNQVMPSFPAQPTAAPTTTTQNNDEDPKP